jgi:hypothetical protein
LVNDIMIWVKIGCSSLLVGSKNRWLWWYRKESPGFEKRGVSWLDGFEKQH